MTENASIPTLTDEQVKEKTEDILEALRDVVDPELGINVVDLGLDVRRAARRPGPGPPWT